MPIHRRHLRWCGITVLAMLAVGLAVIACQHRPVDRTEATAWVADHHPGVLRLTGAELAGLPTGNYLLVDVRPAAEWSISHLAGAFRSEDVGDVLVEAHRRRLNRIIVYCSIGERSSRLAERILARRPDLLIFDLSGGIFTWASEGRPLEDANGCPTRLVHPYDTTWGNLLPADRRAPLSEPRP
jgi:rhodanese-related sulfurtransferase